MRMALTDGATFTGWRGYRSDTVPGKWEIDEGALFYLRGNDGCLLSQMGRGLMLDKSAITGLVDRLEKKAMIERRNDPTDRRAIRLYLTRSVRDAANKALPVVKQQNRAIKKGFSPEEIEVFSRVLRTTIERFGGKPEGKS